MNDQPETNDIGNGDLPTTEHRRRGLLGAVKRKPHWSFRLSLHGIKLFAEIIAVLLLIVGVGVGYLVWQLSQGPISYDGLNRQIAAGIQSRMPPGFLVSVSSAEIGEVVGGLHLSVGGLVIKDETGKPILVTPKAEIGFDGLSLFIGRLVPRDIDLTGLLVSITIRADGSVAISEETADQSEAQAVENSEPTAAPQDANSPASPLAIGSFIDALSNRSGPLGLLDHAMLRNGILRIDDQRRGRQIRYRDLALTFDRTGEAIERIALSAQGEHGTWSASGTLTGRGGEARHLTLQSKDIAVSELLGFAEQGTIPVKTDMPLSFQVAIDVDKNSILTGLSGAITGGRATIILDDPKAPPIKVDEVHGEFTLSDDGNRVILPLIEFVSSDTHWRISGDVGIPKTSSEGWSFALRSEGATIMTDAMGHPPISIDHLSVIGTIEAGFRAVRVNAFEARGQDLNVSGNAIIGAADGRDGLKLELVAQQSNALSLLAFWPSFLVPEVRSYLGQSVMAGTAIVATYRLDLDPSGLRAVIAKAVIPDSAVTLDLAFTNGTLQPDKGLPTLRKLEGKVHVTGQKVGIDILGGTIDSGKGDVLTITDGTYRVYDTSLVPTVADINFHFIGAASNFATVLRSDMMRDISTPPLDPEKTSGSVAMAVKISFPQKPDLKPTDIQVSAEGDLTDLFIDNAFGNENLEGAIVHVVASPQGLVLKGEGKLAGAPAKFEMHQQNGATTRDANVVMTIDDTLREKKGLKTSGLLNGPVTLSFSLKGIGGKRVKGKGELDLTKAAIVGLIPGWTRPSGKPEKATFSISILPDESILLDDLLIDDPSILMKGKAEIGADGVLRSANLSTLRINAADKMSASLEKASIGYKISIQGETLDGRALIKSAFSSQRGQGSISQDLDLDLKVATLSGFNGEVMKNADLHAQTRAGLLKDLRLDGHIGQQPVLGQSARSETGQSVIVIQSADAGSLLRFTDLYKRMNAGSLTFQIATTGEPLAGELSIKRFAILDEAAIADLNTRAGAPGGRAIVTDPKNVQFSRLNTTFTIGSGKIEVSDGVMSGPVLGGTVEGTIDYAKGNVDVKGTLVPAYLVNNFLNKIPLLGQLLGGENEGLFSINYRAYGPIASPQVTYNPLSVVAPGFLRKLFEAGGPTEIVPPSKLPPKELVPIKP